jgi:hypothetical protein
VSRSIGLLLLARSLLTSLSAAVGLIPLSAGLSVALLACEKGREVEVRVSIPGADSTETPASGVGVVALPYDRDSVLASLEARATTPRPHTATLDTLFAQFRGPFTSYTAAAYQSRRLQDSINVVRSDLDSTARTDSTYRELTSRYQRLSDSLAQVERRSDRARVVLNRARSEFVTRSESLRTVVRHWEDSTYQGYDSIVEGLTKARSRQPVTDTTGATGWARFPLPPGRWWIYARAWDTGDPNSEWYWNVPVTSDTVLLSSRTGRRRPRY